MLVAVLSIYVVGSFFHVIVGDGEGGVRDLSGTSLDLEIYCRISRHRVSVVLSLNQASLNRWIERKREQYSLQSCFILVSFLVYHHHEGLSFTSNRLGGPGSRRWFFGCLLCLVADDRMDLRIVGVVL